MANLTETEKLVSKTLAAKPFYAPQMGPVLAGILDRHCHSAEHRRRVCEKAMSLYFGPEGSQQDRCPGPAELMELCGEISVSKSIEASPECRYCEGTGYEDTGSGFKRCRCGGSPMSDKSRLEWSRKNYGKEMENFMMPVEVKRF